MPFNAWAISARTLHPSLTEPLSQNYDSSSRNPQMAYGYDGNCHNPLLPNENHADWEGIFASVRQVYHNYRGILCKPPWEISLRNVFKLSPLTLPLSPANGGEGGGEGEG